MVYLLLKSMFFYHVFLRLDPEYAVTVSSHFKCASMMQLGIRSKLCTEHSGMLLSELSIPNPTRLILNPAP